MRKIKVRIVISCIIMLILSVSFAEVLLKDNFSDLAEDNWAYKKVMFMKEKGILNGFEDGTFKPQEQVTREQFATILSKTLNSTVWYQESSFADVAPDRWSKGYIDTASKYLNIYTNGDELYFKPTDSACREDVIVAIVKSMGFQDNEPDYSLLEKFSDSDTVSPDAKKYIAIAIKNRIISGNDDGTLNPKGSLTRAEISTIIYNVLVEKDVAKDDEKIEEKIKEKTEEKNEESESIEDDINITCSLDTPCYSGQSTTLKVKFGKMPDEAYFHFNNSENPDEWLDESYDINEIPVEDISKSAGKYVYTAEVSPPLKSGTRKIRVVASYDGKELFSEAFSFVIKENPNSLEDKSEIGIAYEQMTSQSENIEVPVIIEVSKEIASEGFYTLIVEDYSCDEEGYPFFFWKTDNGEFQGATSDFKSVKYLPYGDSTVTVYMGDSLGFIATYELDIEPAEE